MSRNAFPLSLKFGRAGLAALAVVTFAGLSLLWCRGERILGNDAFAYLAFAKSFVHEWPDHFGSWWPYGFPLLGAGLSHLGLSVHTALNLVSILALASLLGAFVFNLPSRWFTHPAAPLLVVALAAAPVTFTLAVTTLTEAGFATALFLFAVALARWPGVGAIAAALVCYLAAFSFRYVGIFAAPLLAICWWWHRHDLRGTRRLAVVAAALVFGAVITLGLLYSNYHHYGRVAGPHPVGSERFITWPLHLADLGWSLINGFIPGNFHERLGGSGSLAIVISGLAVAGGAGWLIGRGLRSAEDPLARSLALVAGAYVLAIVSLRASTYFDNLYTARTGFPLLFPLGYLLLAQGPDKRTWQRALAVGASFVIVLGVAQAIRGASPLIARELAPARSALNAVIQPGDVVMVDGPSNSLAAYFPNTFYPLKSRQYPDGSWKPDGDGPDFSAADWIVIGAGGKPGAYAFDPRWAPLLRRAEQAGIGQVVAQDPSFILVHSLRRDPR